MHRRFARSRSSRHAIDPVTTPGGRRQSRSRLRRLVAVALASVLLVGLAVGLASAAPGDSAQAAGPPPSDFVLGTFRCNDFVSYMGPDQGVYERYAFQRSEPLPRTPGSFQTYRFYLVRSTSTGGGPWVVQDDYHMATAICDHSLPTPGQPAPPPMVTPPPVAPPVINVVLPPSPPGPTPEPPPPGDDTSGLFGPDGELLRPDDFPPLDPVGVTNRALETNPSAMESCIAGAGDYVTSIRTQGVGLVKQLLRTELQLLSPADAVGPAVADIVAFLKNPFDYQGAVADPARWLCGQLVGLAFDVGIGKLARGTLRNVDELASDLAEGHPNVRADADIITDPDMLAALAARCVSNSFTADTEVLLADGTTRPIDEVTVGTEVLAADPVTARSAPRPVTELVRGSGPKDLVDLTVAGTRVTATAGHPFWRPDVDRWTDAGDLRVGDTVQSVAGEVPVEAVDHRAENTVVFNLAVEGLHTYFVVAGNVPVLVHNAGCSVADRVAKIRANPLVDGVDRLDKLERDANAGSVGAVGELAALERWLAENRRVRLLPEIQGTVEGAGGTRVPRKNPDFQVDDQIVEVKTPRGPIGEETIGARVGKANTQIERSGLPNNTNGAVEIQLFGPASTGSSAADITRQVLGTPEVPGAFTSTTNLAISRVSVIRDGVLAQEWVRQAGGAVVQTAGAPR